MKTFPAGGPRQDVYDALKRHGFHRSNYSDKVWERADGTCANIYGSGSQLLLTRGGNVIDEGPLGDVLLRDATAT